MDVHIRFFLPLVPISTILYRLCAIMSEIPIEDTPLLTHVDTNLPAIGLSIAVILCVYLAFVAYREFMADSKMSSVMYEETGVEGRYVYNLPEEEKVCRA